MNFSIRKTLPTMALACAASLAFAGGAARADDAMKPAADAIQSDAGMMKAGDKAMADCKEKAGMEADAMKKDEAMKACDAMMKSDGGMMKSDAMGADGAMKPASTN